MAAFPPRLFFPPLPTPNTGVIVEDSHEEAGAEGEKDSICSGTEYVTGINYLRKSFQLLEFIVITSIKLTKIRLYVFEPPTVLSKSISG